MSAIQRVAWIWVIRTVTMAQTAPCVETVQSDTVSGIPPRALLKQVHGLFINRSNGVKEGVPSLTYFDGRTHTVVVPPL